MQMPRAWLRLLGCSISCLELLSGRRTNGDLQYCFGYVTLMLLHDEASYLEKFTSDTDICAT